MGVTSLPKFPEVWESQICVCVYMSVCVCICVYIYICVCVCVCVCLYVCVCIITLQVTISIQLTPSLVHIQVKQRYRLSLKIVSYAPLGGTSNVILRCHQKGFTKTHSFLFGGNSLGETSGGQHKKKKQYIFNLNYISTTSIIIHFCGFSCSFLKALF